MAPQGRWGATFAVQGGQLVATDVHPAGPLFAKGMRKGDVHHRDALAGRSRGAIGSAVRPLCSTSCNRCLGARRWSSSIPATAPPSRPSSFCPAWQPLATLFVGQQRRMGLLDARRILRRLDERLSPLRLAGQSRPAADCPTSIAPISSTRNSNGRTSWSGCCRRAVCTRRSTRRRSCRNCRSTRSCPPRSPLRRGSKFSRLPPEACLHDPTMKVKARVEMPPGCNLIGRQGLRQRRGRDQARVDRRAAGRGRQGTGLSVGALPCPPTART